MPTAPQVGVQQVQPRHVLGRQQAVLGLLGQCPLMYPGVDACEGQTGSQKWVLQRGTKVLYPRANQPRSTAVLVAVGALIFQEEAVGRQVEYPRRAAVLLEEGFQNGRALPARDTEKAGDS